MKRGISVLIEGLDGVGKSTACLKLAEKLNGRIIKTPPESMASGRNYFVNEKPQYREGYYMVGNYISGNEIKEVTESGTNVVIDRFYPSTKAYIHGKDLSFDIESYSEEWPYPILKPDYIFLLRLSNDVRISRLMGRGNMNEEEILIRNNPELSDRINKMFIKIGCIPIDIQEDWSPDRVVDEIMSMINIINTV